MAWVRRRQRRHTLPDAKTIADMIAALDGAAHTLLMLNEAGVVLEAGTQDEDQLCLTTDDAAVAQRFVFTAEEVKEARKEASPEGDKEEGEDKPQDGNDPT